MSATVTPRGASTSPSGTRAHHLGRPGGAANATQRLPYEPCPRGSITTRVYQGQQGLDEFSAAVDVTADPERFRVLSRTARFGRLVVSRLAHGPLRLECHGVNFGHDEPVLRLLVVLSGHVAVTQDGRTEVLGPRDAALVVGWRPCVRQAVEDVQTVQVDVPADLEVLGHLADSLTFTAWSERDVLLGAVGAFLCDLLRKDEASTRVVVRTQVAQALESLVSMAVCQATAPVDPDGERRTQRIQVVQHIAAHYADPELSPASIAERFGMSKRSLQRLFEGERLSVSQWISEKRLEQALLRLRDPRYDGTSLDEIAVLSGFGSALCLRRAVHAATGKTPSEIRSGFDRAS